MNVFSIFNKPYSDVIKSYERILSYGEQNNHQQMCDEVSNCQALIARCRKWPKNSVEQKLYIEADLLFMQAICKDNSGVYDREEKEHLLVLYEQAILSLGQHIRDSRLVGACLNYIDTFMSLGTEEQGISVQKCLDFASLAYTVGEEMHDDLAIAHSNLKRAEIVECYYYDQDILVGEVINSTLDSLAYFEANPEGNILFGIYCHLSRLYLAPSIRCHEENLDNAIAYAMKGLEIQPEKTNNYLLAEIFVNIAESYKFKKTGERTTNITLALFSYEQCLEIISHMEWDSRHSFVVISWLDLVFEAKKVEKYIECVDFYLQKIIEHTNKTDEPEIWFSTIYRKHDLSKRRESIFFSERDTYMSEMIDLLGNVDQNSNPALAARLKISIAEYTSGNSLSEAANKRLRQFKSILSELKNQMTPELQFELEMRIGGCFCDLENWAEADSHFVSALKDVKKFVEGAFRVNSHAQYSFPVDRYILRMPPFVAIHQKSIHRALLYFDYFYSRSMAETMEDLLLIEKQLNRDRFYRQFVEMKQGQRTLIMDDPEGMVKTLDIVSHIRSEFDEMKIGTDYTSREVFYDNLDRFLPQIDTWTLVPIIGNKSSYLVLIPPHSQCEDIIVSPVLDINFLSEMGSLLDEDRGGWMHIIQSYELNSEKSRKAIADMEKRLWKNYGGWVYGVISKRSQKEIPILCIVTVDALGLFPFSMARSPQTEKYLIDSVGICYAPSLYCLFTLHNRLKYNFEEAELTYISSATDIQLRHSDIEQSMVMRQFPSKKRTSLIATDTGFENVRSCCKKTNHWHFATHGEFMWSEAGASALSLGDGQLRANLLVGLDPGRYLRLVVLAACQSGMNDHFGEDRDPDGFLYRFLELGTIGAIGALWKIPDSSASLLLGRFYHYYKRKNLPPALALRKSQIWLRDINCKNLRDFIEKEIQTSVYDDTELESPSAIDLLIDLEQYDDEYRPFASQIHWAGFILMGI